MCSLSGIRIRDLSGGIFCRTDNSVSRLTSWRWNVEWNVNVTEKLLGTWDVLTMQPTNFCKVWLLIVFSFAEAVCGVSQSIVRRVQQLPCQTTTLNLVVYIRTTDWRSGMNSVIICWTGLTSLHSTDFLTAQFDLRFRLAFWCHLLFSFIDLNSWHEWSEWRKTWKL